MIISEEKIKKKYAKLYIFFFSISFNKGKKIYITMIVFASVQKAQEDYTCRSSRSCLLRDIPYKAGNPLFSFLSLFFFFLFFFNIAVHCKALTIDFKMSQLPFKPKHLENVCKTLFANAL